MTSVHDSPRVPRVYSTWVVSAPHYFAGCMLATIVAVHSANRRYRRRTIDAGKRRRDPRRHGLAGLDADEGPFYQTDRFDRYREVIEQWLDDGKAYLCYCSKEDLDERRAGRWSGAKRHAMTAAAATADARRGRRSRGPIQESARRRGRCMTTGSRHGCVRKSRAR